MINGSLYFDFDQLSRSDELIIDSVMEQNATLIDKLWSEIGKW